jgi:NTE family protein
VKFSGNHISGTFVPSVLLALLVAASGIMNAQRVAVVLSGGGATALAHVGFLRVLEENNVPVDYICGTSMGAVVAAMYASGFSVAEIDSLVRTEEFLDMATGNRNDQLDFYFKNADTDASFGSLRLSSGNLISNALPANLINPVLLDWKLMEGFSQADAACSGNFDNLYIPFRCIAADIESKQEIIFRNGPLNVATRASCTFPFYIPARRVDGKLLFDGGIYNNFPIDLAYREFKPDIIIGCNVSGSTPKPKDDNFLSQLQAMILYRSEPVSPLANTVIVKPQLTDISTFDFDKIDEAIEIGYRKTLEQLPSIKQTVIREETLQEKKRNRAAFQNRFPPLLVGQITIEGLKKSQRRYVQKIMAKKETPVQLSELKSRYFKLFGDDKISTIFPTALYQPEKKTFALNLDVKKEKDLILAFGGNFSSRSINTGYIGLKYNLFGLTSTTLSANSYFGRFYGSVHSDIRWDISGSLPISIQGGFTFNRWDYYKSLSTFFEDVKPSFILLNERFGNLALSVPAGAKGILKGEGFYTHQFDEYYQITNFISTDTADRTEFNAWVGKISYERSTLNRKQFASSGSYLQVSLKNLRGEEFTIPGSTSEVRDTTIADHSWYAAKMNYQNYFLNQKHLKSGFYLEGVWSSQDFFNNFISSSIAAPSFNPIPESRTYFLPQFRAYMYAAAGLMNVISFTKNFELRLEVYSYRPFKSIVRDEFGKAAYDSKPALQYIGSATLLIQTPLGPMSMGANYYDRKDERWSFIFNFGYILFNRSPRD